MNKIICPKCNTENSNKLKYCSKCSHKLLKEEGSVAEHKIEAANTVSLFQQYYPYLLGVVVFIVAFFTTQNLLSPSINKAMVEAASEINKSCPMMVDAETQLDNVVALPDNVFQYNYTLVNVLESNLDVDIQLVKDGLTPEIINNVKTNPDLAFYRENKTTVEYNYKDKEGSFLMKISVSPDLYE